MKFYKEVIANLFKTAFEGHTKFSVADNTAVGDNPVRSISLDATPANENSIISLSWEGGEKLFEKTLSEQEASHQFDLISTDLAEVAALTKQGQYDAAKDLMKKLGQKYAENTGDIVDTNLPKLHNTQASEKVAISSTNLQEGDKVYVDTDTTEWGRVVGPATILENPVLNKHNILVNVESVRADILVPFKDIFKQAAQKCERCEDIRSEEDPSHEYDPDCAGSLCAKHEEEWNKKKSSQDDKLWRKAKITMQNLWFSDTKELLEYQEKQKGAKSTQDHIPLWDAQKGKGPAKGDSLAPASLSYEDVENEKERDHEDMQKHIDEKIKTELESALQEKAASVFGPADIELVKSLRAPGIGRNWDEIKKIFIKDLNRDKDATTIFLDEQRESLDPTGIEVEPVKEEKPLTPPEELVSPETHEKLLQDHEDKKKAPLTDSKEPSFTPKDVMDIPEDDEIKEQSAQVEEIARADNDDIHKVAAPSDLNPLQEPLTEKPTTPNQDVVPMGKKPTDHNAPQHGDRVFVTTDLSNEKSGFEADFIQDYKGDHGQDFALVQTDQGDQLNVERNRVVKINDGSSGAQETEPVMEPQIEQQQPNEDVQVTPKMDDLHTSSQDPFLALKKEAEALLKEIDSMGKTSYMFVKKGLEKHAGDSAFEANGWTRVWVDESEIEVEPEYAEILKMPDENARIQALKELARKVAQDTLRTKANAGGDIAQMWFDSLKPSDHDRIDWVKLANPTTDEEREWQEEQKGRFSSQDIKIEKQAKLYVGVSSQKPNWEVFESPVPPTQDKFPYNAVIGPFKTKEGAEFMAMYGKNNPQLQTVDDAERAAHQPKQASDFEKGISQNKTSADKIHCNNCGWEGLPEKDLSICPNCKERSGLNLSKEAAEPDQVDLIMAYEDGQLDDAGILKLFSMLIKSGQAWSLQGSYGRTAKALIDAGYINEKGTITKDVVDTEVVPEQKMLSKQYAFKNEKTAADPVEAPKTQFKDYKITPKYTPKEQAVPATPEMDEVLTKMNSLQSNLATLEAARKQIQAKMKEELEKIDQQGGRAEMEAALQETIEKTAVILSAMDNKVVQWKDKLFTLQTEQIDEVPSLTPKEMLAKIYAKFEGAEKYVQDVLNGMLSQAKRVVEKTLIRWPNKNSSLNKEATIIDDINHYNEELLAALKELSSPL